MNIKLLTGDCGYRVTKLVYFKCTNCLLDIYWTCTVIIDTLLWQGYYMSAHLISKNSAQTEIAKDNVLHV
jgi:hypothetical protein